MVVQLSHYWFSDNSYIQKQGSIHPSRMKQHMHKLGKNPFDAYFHNNFLGRNTFDDTIIWSTRTDLDE